MHQGGVQPPALSARTAAGLTAEQHSTHRAPACSSAEAPRPRRAERGTGAPIVCHCGGPRNNEHTFNCRCETDGVSQAQGEAKRSDPRLLSQFFFADERVTRVVAEINGLDAELDPQQYLALLNQLHLSQAQLLAVIERIMEECIPTQRHSRDYLIKFPEELLVDNLGNHMLFAAECLLAGTFLEVEEAEGVQLRPRARNLLCSLELVRALLREQSLSQPSTYPEPVRAALVQFDHLFAEFELSYVSSLVAVKSPDEIYRQQEIIVLFCETVERALRLGYLTQEMIDGYEPLLMFTIPRLAIIRCVQPPALPGVPRGALC
ncbi:lateral signaling target protein 2 homolog [Cyrtonyx montezumae]|uniref:lateral signaling target protein 2 homolog n=1 Tax=Cyrtonyx montezumae TaxID=9017 RepID=UPI0032DAC4E8